MQEERIIRVHLELHFYAKSTVLMELRLIWERTEGIYIKTCKYVLCWYREIFIINSYIPKFSNSSFFTHEEKRDRKLLLNKVEIRKLIGKVKIKGYALIPLKVYSKKSLIKLEIGLGKGKKLYDKRRDLKKKDVKRELERTFKNKTSI